VRQNTKSLLERAGKNSRWPRVTPSPMNPVPRPGFDQKPGIPRALDYYCRADYVQRYGPETRQPDQ